MSEPGLPLQGRLIALPESRQLDLMAGLLERRGANTLRCPLLAIHDAPDKQPIEQWLQEFIDSPPDELILLTGEGLRRLCGFAERAGVKPQFLVALEEVRTLIRGPKPGAAMRELGLRPSLQAVVPTTEGVITTLDEFDLSGRSVGVQLYGSDPNIRLVEYLAGRGCKVRPVAPYIYADQMDEQQVEKLIGELVGGRVDAVAFTSQPQIKRLFKVAKKNGLEQGLRDGLAQTCVAVVGPLVAAKLEALDVRVDLMPDSSFFMKPLVSELVRWFAAKAL